MTLHDFNQSLRYSHGQADAPWWQQVYRQAFPDILSTVDLRHDGWHQRAGRDRAVVLSTGRTIYVDEKVRKDVYPDIAIEVWSCYPIAGGPPYLPVSAAVPGWAVTPKDCDYLAYAFVPIRTCYLFPYLGLRAAWERHGGTWRSKAEWKEDGYRWISAENHRYQTISIAVPIRLLHTAIQDALTITWVEGAA